MSCQGSVIAIDDLCEPSGRLSLLRAVSSHLISNQWTSRATPRSAAEVAIFFFTWRSFREHGHFTTAMGPSLFGSVPPFLLLPFSLKHFGRKERAGNSPQVRSTPGRTARFSGRILTSGPTWASPASSTTSSPGASSVIRY